MNVTCNVRCQTNPRHRVVRLDNFSYPKNVENVLKVSTQLCKMVLTNEEKAIRLEIRRQKRSAYNKKYYTQRSQDPTFQEKCRVRAAENRKKNNDLLAKYRAKFGDL